MAIPRVGHEVIVDFIDGDPDRPIITGRVYNGQNKTPYKLPADRTKTTIKSNTSPGGRGSNELRFEDKKNHEEVYIHAQKDQNNVVENNETTKVGVDRTEDVGNDETISIGNDRTETVGVNENISIGENRTKSVGNDETISIGENRSISVGVDQTTTIGQDRVEHINQDEIVHIGRNQSINVGDVLSLTCGASSIEMYSNGMIKIRGINIEMIGAKSVDVIGELVEIN